MFTLLFGLERSDTDSNEIIHTLQGYQYISESKEFIQTCTADQVVEWCMKDAFYFTHINQVLRSQNLQDIVAHRALIHDIEQRVRSLHEEQQFIWDAFFPNVCLSWSKDVQTRASILANEYSFDHHDDFLSIH